MKYPVQKLFVEKSAQLKVLNSFRNMKGIRLTNKQKSRYLKKNFELHGNKQIEFYIMINSI